MNPFSFPLLGKELTEAAARKRTYVIRVIYAALLFGITAVMVPRLLSASSNNAFAPIGAGSEIFETILILQFFGLALFLPAMMCGSITHEKERDSLVLLLLTDLRPWSIVFQKYVSGLVPMLSFFLLSMPLMGIAYAFGGITTDHLLLGILALLLAALQIGAMSLMLSAWCRTTVGALIGTYFFGLLFYAGPPLSFVLYSHLAGISRVDEHALLLFPPNLAVASSWDLSAVVIPMTAILCSTGVFLALARYHLVRRAFVPSSSVFLRWFRRLDGFMQRMNRFAGNVILIRDGRSLPGDDPVAWREMTTKALGKTRYLIRILVAVEVPVLLLCVAAMFTANSYSTQSEGLSIMSAIAGALGVLALGAQAANSIVSDRVGQTLEVLLTTPLTAREIVEQKARALWRVILLVAIPLLTIFASECWLEHDVHRDWPEDAFQRGSDSAASYLVCSVLTVFIYLPLVVWLSLWIGLKMRTRFKAILAALASIVAWCVLPLMAMAFAHNWLALRTRLPENFDDLVLLSPLAIAALNEQSRLHDFRSASFAREWFCIAANFSFYGIILWLIRRLALTRADRYLRR